MFLPPVLCLEALCHTSKAVHIRAATRGTYTGDHAWYTYGRLRVVHIQAIMPGTHTGGYAWYILARSMTITPHQNFENQICEKYASSEVSFSTGSLACRGTIRVSMRVKRPVPIFDSSSIMVLLFTHIRAILCIWVQDAPILNGNLKKIVPTR